jgi:predicted AlkP superfamily pyrophosphatase or phosphodiesterase
MKKTMAEVALNIESRLTADEARKLMEDKVSRADFQYHLQNKPSFDDIKHIMDQMQPTTHEVYEDELSKMRARLEELYKEVHRKATQQLSTAHHGDLQLLQATLDSRFADLEEKLNEKANKQSVAQALHRKANKPEVDAHLAKKAELSDL